MFNLYLIWRVRRLFSQKNLRFKKRSFEFIILRFICYLVHHIPYNAVWTFTAYPEKLIYLEVFQSYLNWVIWNFTDVSF